MFFVPMQRGAEAAVDVDLNYTGIGAQNVDPAGMATVVEAATNQEPDAIIACNFFPEGTDPVLKRAQEAGIPVFILAPEGTTVEAVATVGVSDLKGGREAGRLMLEAGIKRPICVNPVPNNPSVVDRCDGLTEVYEDAGLEAVTLNLADALTNTTVYVNSVKGALASDPKIDGFFALGPSQAPLALQAISQAGRDGQIKFGSYDFSSEIRANIKDGKIMFALWQQQYAMAFTLVTYATNFVRYGMTPMGNTSFGPCCDARERRFGRRRR